MFQGKVNIPTYHNWRTLQLVKSHNLAYVEWGSPENEVLICCHALIRNSRDFDKIAEALSSKFRVICFDVAGRGESDWLEDENCYNYDTYINDSLLLLNALSIKSCHWLGTSMGGLIGMTLASLHPYLIKSLILNDIGPLLPNNSLTKITKYVAYDPEFNNMDEAKLHFKKIYASFGITTEEVWDHLTYYSIKKMPNDKYKMAYDPKISKSLNKYMNNSQDVDLWYIWHSIICTVLVLRGELSDILTTFINPAQFLIFGSNVFS
jgi:pimeloyl-ACP methyl ester carboxylesterase